MKISDYQLTEVSNPEIKNVSRRKTELLCGEIASIAGRLSTLQAHACKRIAISTSSDTMGSSDCTNL
jgi:hypothetical protein